MALTPTKKGGVLSVLALLLISLCFTLHPVEAKDPPLRIGLTAVTVEDFLQLHKHLIHYISKKLGIPVELVFRKGYQEMNDLLRKGDVDVAFVCSLPYIMGHDSFGLELLVAPVIHGRPLYRSYVIVPMDSGARRLRDLKGKVYAFSDPLSNSGRLVPAYLLARMGETPETFFKSYIYTQSHYNSIEAVAVGLVDGASVDSYVWELANSINPEFTSKTKVIERSPLYPITPFVIRKEIDPGLKERVRGVLMGMHRDEEGRKILNDLKIDMFVQVDDSFYRPIREMINFVDGFNGDMQR